MDKLFVYNVNGTVLEDTEAFGKAWKRAKEIATEEHVGIERQVVCGDSISNEFYAKGGCFLNERFYSAEKVKIF